MEKIHIPKVKKGRYALQINRSNGQSVSKNSLYYDVILKKQEVAGFTIPAGTTMRVLHIEQFSGFCHVSDEELNSLLRKLYLDTIRAKLNEKSQ